MGTGVVICLPHTHPKPGGLPVMVLVSPNPFASAKFSLPLFPLSPRGLPGGVALSL